MAGSQRPVSRSRVHVAWTLRRHDARLTDRADQVLLYGATTGYLLAGLLGLASIGLFLIVAGVLACIGAGPRRVPVGVVAAVVAVSASALIIGMALT